MTSQHVGRVRRGAGGPQGHPPGTPQQQSEAVRPAWRPVLVIAGCLGAVLLATSGRYGYFVDELYFIAAGERPDWGYADQPPLVPLLAHGLDVVFDGSLVGLRLPATLVTAAGVVVTALIVAEFGGARRAQLIAAGAYAVSTGILQTGHVLQTATLDVFGWTVVTWLIVRWVRRRDDRLLWWAGVTAAVVVQVKYLILPFLVVVLGCALAVGPRELLRRRALWGGGGLVATSLLPSLIWQARHGWPQLDMLGVIAAEQSRLDHGRWAFLPGIILYSGIGVGAVLLAYGLYRILRDPAFRDYRFLGIAFAVLLVTFTVAGGRAYYLQGLFPLLWAAAAVDSRLHRVLRAPAYLCSGLLAVALSLPIYPLSWLDDSPQATGTAARSVGWQALAHAVADVAETLPPSTVVVTETYAQAAAIEHFAPQLRGNVYSGHRGYWYFGRPHGESDVLYVGSDNSELREGFQQARRAGTVDAGIGIAVRGVPIWHYEGQHQPWAQLWPRLRHLD